MTESEARIKISKSINDVLKAIYKNINNKNFDMLIDLSNVPSTTLKDFWIYTAGFLGLKNQKDFDNMLTDQEVKDILMGGFRLIDLPLDQAQEFALRSKKKVPDQGAGITINLYSVQDGTYSINKMMIHSTFADFIRGRVKSVELDGVKIKVVKTEKGLSFGKLPEALISLNQQPAVNRIKSEICKLIMPN